MKISLKLKYLLNHCLDSYQLAQLYLQDNLKSLLCFGDLDPILKSLANLQKLILLLK